MMLFFILLSQGIKQEGEETGYERTSDMYKDLVTLLKSRSPHFAQNVTEQVKWNAARCNYHLLIETSVQRHVASEMALCPQNKVPLSLNLQI